MARIPIHSHHGRDDQWCHCITNERAVAIAEEVLQHMFSKYYGEACMGSMADITVVLNTIVMGMNAAETAAYAAREGLKIRGENYDPKDPKFRMVYAMLVPLAQSAAQDRASAVFDEFSEKHAKDSHVRFDKLLGTLNELRKADEAFDASSKTT